MGNRSRKGIDPKTGEKEEKGIDASRPRKDKPVAFSNVSKEGEQRLSKQTTITPTEASAPLRAKGLSPAQFTDVGAKQLIEEKEERRLGNADKLREEGVFNPIPQSERELVLDIGEPGSREQIREFAEEERRNSFLGKIEQKLADTTEAQLSEESTPMQILLSGKRAYYQKAFQIASVSSLVGKTIAEVTSFSDLFNNLIASRSEVVQNTKGNIETRKEMASNLGTQVKEGTLSPDEAFALLRAMENSNEIDVRTIQREASLSPGIRKSKEVREISTDLLELEQEIAFARREIAGALIGEQDPEALFRSLEQLDKLTINQ